MSSSVSSAAATLYAKLIGGLEPRLDRYAERATGDDPWTEDAMAQRFAERHKDDLRYVALRGQWYNWDGTGWRLEDRGWGFDLARHSIRQDKKEFGNGIPPQGVSSAKTIAAIERIGQADRLLAARLDQFDADNSLLNASN